MTGRLETARLVLRRLASRDAGGYIAFCRSRRARHSLGVKSADEAWRAFGLELGHWELRGYGMFAVTEKGGGDTCLGIVGPWFPAGWPEREIGWLMWPEGEGRGYAEEAARAARDHAFDTLGWDTAVSYIADGNARSIALAERLGAVLDPGAPTLSADALVYRHPRRPATSPEGADA